jgi:hypothetical protein
VTNEITEFVHKIILILLLTGFFAPGLLAQSNTEPLYKSRSEENLYKSKVGSYRKMRNVGLGLGIAGGVLTTAGIVMLASADWEEQPPANGTGTTYTTRDSGSAVGGILCLFTGIPMLGTGAVLGGIGSYKMKQYQRKLEGMTLNFKYTPHQRGVAFTYCF